MPTATRRVSRVIPAALIAFLVALSHLPALAEFEEHATFDADALVLTNLIGEVRVQGGEGTTFRVDVAVRGRDASRERIRMESDEGAEATFTVRFPLEDEKRYVYPRLGRGSNTSFTVHEDGADDSWLRKILSLGRGQIRVSGSGSGLEVWADVTVTVPRGKELTVRHGVGTVSAEGVEGNLLLDTRSGGVSARAVVGDLVVDTGSGHVEIEEVEGELNVDTGSGHVSLSRAEGPTIFVDTGSGRVTAETVTCDRLSIDTGSGSVRAAAIRANSLSIDTGSGSVELELAGMGDGHFDVDTGSGSITLIVPPEASAHVNAETGGGGIHVDLAGIEIFHKERDEIQFRIGSGAAAVQLDTGSGAIRIHP